MLGYESSADELQAEFVNKTLAKEVSVAAGPENVVPEAAKLLAGRQATYKGHVYNVKWVGLTPFGRRVKLAFLNGKKTFWANAADVTAL